MDEKQLKNMWNYFLSLEQDLSNTSRFVEPQGQENVYSFEFAKILILACTEVESAFKALCKSIDGLEYGVISKYKEIIMKKYPKIINAEVTVSRLEKTFKPFSEWGCGPLSWWDAYGTIKHSRGSNFQNATYLNAVLALAALYVLILYLAKTLGYEIDDYKSEYITSEYASGFLIADSGVNLPDFENEEKKSALTVKGEILTVNIGLDNGK